MLELFLHPDNCSDADTNKTNICKCKWEPENTYCI